MADDCTKSVKTDLLFTDRLFKNDKAIDAVYELRLARFSEEYCTEYEIGYNDGLEYAVGILSRYILDADEDVVRCKDCKYWDRSLLWGTYCGRYKAATSDCDYCSFGELKE